MKALNEYKMNVVITKILVDTSGMQCGFSDSKFYYYHDPISITDTSLPVILIPYDPIDIDAAICSNIASIEQVSKLALSAKYKNHLYRLFCAEFSSVIQSEVNIHIRKMILSRVQQTKFDNVKSVADLCNSVNSLLESEELVSQFDSNIIREVILAASIHPEPIEFIENTFNISKFEFDRMSFRRLQATKSHVECLGILHSLLDEHLDTKSPPPEITGNIYTSCAKSMTYNDQTVHCAKNKLIVPNDLVHALFDILAYDIHTPGKFIDLISSSAGVYDLLDFRKNSNEYLNIRIA
jgi:hypothetical protein